MTKKVKEVVLKVLETNKTSRANDLVLSAKVLKKLGLPTDIEELSKLQSENIIDSIGRYRRLYQKLNPSLLPSKQTAKNRRNRELRMRKEMRL